MKQLQVCLLWVGASWDDELSEMLTYNERLLAQVYVGTSVLEMEKF